jgi:hypothetical protein
VEPWSADDPWQERRDPSPGWDEWPPTAPSADDFTVDEPASPASDPWAESWADDVPGIPTSPPPPELERYAEPASDVGFEPSQPPAFDSTEAPVAPAFEPSVDEPEPQPIADAEPQPFVEAQPAGAPRIEPWSSDSDPWGAAWTVPSAVDEPTADQPVADELDAAVPPVEEAGVQDELDAGVAAAPSSGDAWQAPEPGPEVEPEPPQAQDGSGDDGPNLAEAAIADMAVEGATDETPALAEDDSRDDERSIADAALAAAAGAAVVGAAGDEAPSEARSPWPWRRTAEPEPEPEPVAEADAAPEPAAEPEAEPEPEVEAEPAAEAEPEPVAESKPAPIWAAAAVPAAEGAVTAEAADETAAAESSVSDEATTAEPTEPDRSWETDAWSEPDSAAAAVGAADAEPEQPGDEETHLPEAAIAAAAIAASQPEVDARRPDVPWLDRPDQTEVYPTTWEPPPPPPPPAGRGEAGIEPRSGDIRTTLGQPEPELDDELLEEPTTAEQAVPWLIGVILLLAGMVIVLLALIFAGDASLGGASGASPTPTAAAIAGGSGIPASSTPPTSPSPSASASAEPSPSTVAIPEYGALEMIYQGRSAALAPIYLLHRDFTVEGEPEVLAQDASLDVRRFAWSPDGTRGAFLYADLLVAMDPGVDVHRLSDGMHAITFGNDAATVYAVRVVADGGNDVASILAVNQATGDERELDRVSYPRPAIEEEASLAEAQFSDDGGSVRLYWMHDGKLRLWILGAGAWTVDPAEGNATKLDEDALPVLWAPEGERRIGLAPEGDKTTLIMVDRAGHRTATATVTGRVSHLRWSPRGDQVVFTLGRSASGGGVLQDLYLWNLGAGDDPAPMMITNTGAAFGAEWRGSQSRWEED